MRCDPRSDDSSSCHSLLPTGNSNSYLRERTYAKAWSPSNVKHPGVGTLSPVLGSRAAKSNGTVTPPTASTSVLNVQKSTWMKWSMPTPKFS